MSWLCYCCPKKNQLQDELLTSQDNSSFGNTQIKQNSTERIAAMDSPYTIQTAIIKQQQGRKSSLIDDALDTIKQEQVEEETKQQKGKKQSWPTTPKSMSGKQQKMDFASNSKRFQKQISIQPKQNIIFKKSHLANENPKADLIYFNMRKDNYVFCCYRYVRKYEQKGYSNSLSYFLTKNHDKVIGVIGKSFMLTNRIDALKNKYHNVIVINYKQSSVNSQQASGISDFVITDDLSKVRLSGMDLIVFLMDKLNNSQEVSEYVLKMVESLNQHDLSKIVYFFPVFMTLEEISQLLYSIVQSHVSNFTIQRTCSQLNFQLEWVEISSLDSAIVVKTKDILARKSNAYYDEIKIPMALFGKMVNQEKLRKKFRDFYFSIKTRPMREFFRYKHILQENIKQSRTKIKEFRNWDNEDFIKVESRSSLSQYKCEKTGFYYTISQDIRDSIKKTDKNLEKQDKKKVMDSPYQKEWDDDLHVEDIKLAKPQQNRILEMISNKGIQDDRETQQTFNFLEELMLGDKKSSQNKDSFEKYRVHQNSVDSLSANEDQFANINRKESIYILDIQ